MSVGDPDPTDANSEEWQQGSFPGVKKVNISCPGTGLLGSPLSGHGLDGRAIDCQAWVLALLTPSWTVGPTHELAMSRSPLERSPEQAKVYGKNMVGGDPGGPVAGSDEDNV